MTNMIYGAAGVLSVLLLLFIGAFIGWKVRIAYEKHNRKVLVEQLSEEERSRLIEDQRAFEDMLHYNIDMAYGTPQSLKDLARG